MRPHGTAGTAARRVLYCVLLAAVPEGARGKPGESSKRNTQRQQIPIALAKLGAAEAVPALERTLRTHHDYWERRHAAYALARLMDAEASGRVEQFLVANQEENDNRDIVNGVRGNRLVRLAPLLATVPKQTKSDDVRAMSREALAALGQ